MCTQQQCARVTYPFTTMVGVPVPPAKRMTLPPYTESSCERKAPSMAGLPGASHGLLPNWPMSTSLSLAPVPALKKMSPLSWSTSTYEMGPRKNCAQMVSSSKMGSSAPSVVSLPEPVMGQRERRPSVLQPSTSASVRSPCTPLSVHCVPTGSTCCKHHTHAHAHAQTQQGKQQHV